MKNPLLLTAVAMMLTVAPFSVHAEDAAKTEPAKKSSFGPVDANGDNVVTKAEADAAAGLEFTMFDADKDSKISKDEFKNVLMKMNAKALPDDAAKKKAEPLIMERYGFLDTNKDGSIAKDEFLSDSTKRHKMFDENGDGKVTKAEVENVGAKMKKKIEAMRAAAKAKAEATPAKK